MGFIENVLSGKKSGLPLREGEDLFGPLSGVQDAWCACAGGRDHPQTRRERDELVPAEVRAGCIEYIFSRIPAGSLLRQRSGVDDRASRYMAAKIAATWKRAALRRLLCNFVLCFATVFAASAQVAAGAPASAGISASAGVVAPASILTSVPASAGISASTGVEVGMTDTAAYFPLLEGRRVALLANHTSVAEMPGAPGAAVQSDVSATGDAARCRVHLADLLHDRKFDVTAIFSPEHGFRGSAGAGEKVKNSVDERTGIPIRSLYDGKTGRPSAEAMRSFDVLVVDMQDVGLRFYTYYISMLRMMDACADYGRQVIVLDRPNPNIDKVDGPVLDMNYASGVGALPVPVLHGLTMGEIARMAVGEGWAKACDLIVVPCRHYTRSTEYILPVAPSPNLPTQRAVYLYASLCLFEGTPVSVGRGTDKPFEVYGHPDLEEGTFAFTPRSVAGALHPPFEGVLCRGEDLSVLPLAEARRTGLSLAWLLGAYRSLGLGGRFFTPMFEKLIGTGDVRRMILDGRSEAEIRACWQPDLVRYLELRRPYLLYDE